MSALEALVGQRLIERSRGRRTVQLTEAGRVLLGHAVAIVEESPAASTFSRPLVIGVDGDDRLRSGLSPFHLTFAAGV